MIDVIQPNGQKVVHFSYEPVFYTFTTKASDTKVFSLTFGCTDKDRLHYKTTNAYSGVRLKEISFVNGRIEMEANQERCDLPGDNKLNGVRIYRKNETAPFRQFILSHSYFGPSGVANPDCSNSPEEALRLKLDEIREVSGDQTIAKGSYKFDYDPTHLPDRLSNAQDHWGYYNGKNNNPHLVETYYYQVGAETREISGADRFSNEDFAKAGLLTKVTYPTGGVTSFEYEGNTTSSAIVPVPLISKSAVANWEQGVGVNSSPFTVNNPIGNGALISINFNVNNIDFPPCNPELCFRMFIRGVSDPQFNKEFYGHQSIVYLANGTYQIETTNTIDPAYTDFSVIFEWKEKNRVINKPVGGLRICNLIQDPDGIIDNGNEVIKTYKYHKFDDELTSSGIIGNFPLYEYRLDEIRDHRPDEACNYLVKSSYSNYPLIATQGSYVGYANVTVFDSSGIGNGKTTYKYTAASNYNDFIGSADDFPFTPPTSYAWKRGLLLNTKYFKSLLGDYQLVNETINTYAFLNDPDNELRTDVKGIVAGYNPSFTGGGGNLFPIEDLFSTVSEWYYLANTIERFADENDPNKLMSISTDYHYENLAHIQLTRQFTINSEKDTLINEFTYPLDNVTVTPAIQKMRDTHKYF